MTRRLALCAVAVFTAGAAAGLLAGSALSAAGPRMWADVLLTRTTSEIPRKVSLRVNDDHWDPGAEGGWHRHPGPTILYVIEGELSEATRQGTNTLKRGQAVWRSASHEHNVRNPGPGPARALAIHLDPAH
ncbi:MAG: cupin domain-containing protein [Candidatus Rokubacteria bacterium]|nr:cupin domain-containing protein [Candidatus Rokubacteria bacterium]MBI2526514.1 cupin domain-containing protein [Candidatus Rokubacteria bacterium]